MTVSCEMSLFVTVEKWTLSSHKSCGGQSCKIYFCTGDLGLKGPKTTCTLNQCCQWESGFLSSEQNASHHCERAWKTVSENGVGICMHFCMRSFMHLERCVEYTQGNPSSKAKVVCACHPCEVFCCRDDAKKGCFSKIEKNIISSCHLHITLLQLHTH